MKIFLLLFFVALPVAADVVLEFTDNGEPSAAIEIQGSKVRMNITDDPNYMLYFHQDKTLFMVDAQQKTIQKFSDEAMDGMIAQAKQMRKLVQFKAIGLDESGLALLKKEMGTAAGLLEPLPEYSVEKTNRQSTVLNKACSIVNVFINAKKAFEYCIQTTQQLQLNNDEASALSGLLQRMAKMTQGFAADKNSMVAVSPKDLGGIPVHIVAVNDEYESSLVDIKKTDIEQKRFSLPESYQKIEF